MLRRQRGVIAFGKRALDPIVHRVKDRAFVGETDLNLGRVNVDVGLGEGDGEVEHAGRELADHNRMLVRLLQRRPRRAALDIAAVDKEGLHGAVGAAGRRQGDIAADMDLPLGVVHLGQIFGKVPSKDGVHRRKQLAVPGSVQPGLSFPDKLEGDFRMGERDALHHRRYRVALLDVLL